MRVLELFSGGKESVYSLTYLKEHKHDVVLLLFDYGQASFTRELRSARYYGKKYDCRVVVRKVDLEAPLPIRLGTAGNDHVVFRNGVFLSLAVNYLDHYKCDTISIGVTNTGDHGDGSEEFLKNFRKLMRLMYPAAKFISPTSRYSGYELYVKLMRDYIDIQEVWSCMTSKEGGYCGICEKCQTFIKEYKAGKYVGQPGYPHYVRYAEYFYGLFIS